MLIGRLGFALLLLLTSCQIDYAREVQRSLRQAYGSDLPEYTFRGTPVGSFGVGTIYLNDITRSSTPDNSWLIGSLHSWFDDGVPAEERASLIKGIIEEGDLGDVQLKAGISTTLDLGVVLPNIYGALDIAAGVDVKSGVTVVLSATQAANRRINWTRMQQAIDKGLINKVTTQHLLDRDVVMGAADIVLGGYTATVTVDATVNPTLKSSLDRAVGNVLGKDSGLTFSLDRQQNGTYKISATQPVVAAVLYLAPPPTKGSGARSATISFSDLYDWKKIHLDEHSMAVIESERALR